jgi:hypothetical protein
MPAGPAERGVEANASAHLVSSARHAESIDGAEPSGSIERVMAGAACSRIRDSFLASRVQSCAIDITNGRGW